MKNERIRFPLLPSWEQMTPPLIALLSANLITIVLAIAQDWDAATVIFIYWVQSVIIGIFTVIAILDADASAVAEDVNQQLREKGEAGTVTLRGARSHTTFLAVFFCSHYGIFHIAYYSIFIQDAMFGPVNISSPVTWFSCGVFFVSHLYSYVFYRNRIRRGEDFVTDSFITPYARVVPMHLLILTGGAVILVLQMFGITSTLPVLVVFLLTKTGVDLALHLQKHTGDLLKWMCRG